MWKNVIRSDEVQSYASSTGIKNSEYDQEIPQSQTADNPLAP